MTLPRKSAVVLVVLALLLLIVATGTYVSNSSIHLLCVYIYISFYISSYIYHRTCTYVVYMHVQRPSRRRRRGAPRSTSPSWSHSTWGVRVRPVVRYHCPIPLAALHDVSSEQPTGDSVASSWRFWWWLVRGRTGLQISFRSLLVLPTLFWSSLEEIINVMWLAPLISTVCVCCYQKNKLLCRRSCACACMRRLHAALDMVGMEIWTNPDGIESGCCFYRYFNSNMRKNTGSNV